MAADYRIKVELKDGAPYAEPVCVDIRSDKVIVQWYLEDENTDIKRILGVCFERAGRRVFKEIEAESEDGRAWTAINRAKSNPRGKFHYEIKVELCDGSIVGRDPEIENNVPQVFARIR
ncbi:hypothetical protein [Pseudomarimonas arenosa]|uniref:Uncharacterized protein n=1 Tax=Pseudomarimonas arenosa TaxID=2774145 RepID=A0AAW3ZT94_9GAMM|nr:hypothetical protein [Pseudomarimonas arenosa]MBD8528055.1 hypothetical protein [Pseudomarimonas arenosa]